MAGFNWRNAIVVLALEVESALCVARQADELSRARLEREAQSKAEHAAWLARGYGYRYRSPAMRKRVPA